MDSQQQQPQKSPSSSPPTRATPTSKSPPMTLPEEPLINNNNDSSGNDHNEEDTSNNASFNNRHHQQHTPQESRNINMQKPQTPSPRRTSAINLVSSCSSGNNNNNASKAVVREQECDTSPQSSPMREIEDGDGCGEDDQRPSQQNPTPSSNNNNDNNDKRKKKTYPRPYYTSNIGTMSRKCGGRCICPSDAWHAYILLFFIFAPVAVFFSSVIPPSEWYSFVIVSLGILGVVVTLMFAVTCDPGIQPRRLVTPMEQARVMNARNNQYQKLEKAKVPKQEGRQIQDSEEGGGNNQDTYVEVESDEEHPHRLDMTRITEVLVNDGKYAVEVGMCSTCAIPRPPRSGHCWHCNVCVEEFDHHCGVLGSCVAKRTFRFFAGFMHFTTATTLYIGIRSLIELIHHIEWNPSDDMGKWRIAACIGLIINASIILCITLPMAIYYLQLACINSSQKQALQGSRGMGVHTTTKEKVANPYHQGYITNFFKRMFGPMGRSLMKDDPSVAYYLTESDEEEGAAAPTSSRA